MPIGAINQLLAEPWDGFRKTLEASVEAAVEGSQRLSGSLKIPLLEATADLKRPPGYTAVGPDGFAVALPLDEDGWTVEVNGRLETRILGAKVKIPLELEIRKLRLKLEVQVVRDPADPDRPRLAPGFPRGELHVTLKVERPIRAEVATVLRFPDASGTLTSQRVSGALRDLETEEGAAPAQGDAELRLVVRTEPRAALFVEGRISLNGRPIRVKEKLVDLEDLSPLARGLLTGQPVELPREWGTPTVTLDPAPAGLDFRAAAARLEDAIRENMPFGTVFDVRKLERVAGAAQPGDVSYEGYIDSAIWSGHYLAAQAFRFHVTSGAEHQAALARLEAVVGGIEKLFRITEPATGETGLLARCALPASSPIQTAPPLNHPPEERADRYYGPVPIDGQDWFGYGADNHPPSRDQYTGALVGLTYAFFFLGVPTRDGTAPTPATRALRRRARVLLQNALEFFRRHDWTIPTPPQQEVRVHFLHEFIAQLTLLRIGVLIDPEQFRNPYRELEQAFEAYWVGIWATCLDPIGSYYKFNLLHAQLGLFFFLEAEAPFADATPAAAAAARDCYRILRRTIRSHRNAYFDLVRVLVEPPDGRDSLLAAQHEGCDPALTLREEIRALLAEWLERASPEGVVARPSQATPDPAGLRDLFPISVLRFEPLFPKIGLETGQVGPIRAVVAAKSALPVPLRPGVHMDFIWQRDPFTTGLRQDPAFTFPKPLLEVDPGDPSVTGPGIDYLLPYWIGRYLEVL